MLILCPLCCLSTLYWWASVTHNLIYAHSFCTHSRNLAQVSTTPSSLLSPPFSASNVRLRRAYLQGRDTLIRAFMYLCNCCLLTKWPSSSAAIRWINHDNPRILGIPGLQQIISITELFLSNQINGLFLNLDAPEVTGMKFEPLFLDKWHVSSALQ